MNLSFTKCTIKDLDSLISISKNTFVVAFEKANNPADFQAYIDTAFSESRMTEELLDPDTEFYFTYLDDDLVGYFKLNQNKAQNEQFDQPSTELERIYVLNSYQGRKIGKFMLLEAIDISKAKGVAFIWLGVWEKNLDAVRFYEYHGFIKFSTHPYYLGKDKQTDWLMKLDLI